MKLFRRRSVQVLSYGVLGVSVLIAGVAVLMLGRTSEPVMPPTTAIYLDSNAPTTERVADLLSYMTRAEKIGQMALVEKNSLREPQDIATYHLGALLSGSGAKPVENTTAGWREMITGFQAEAASSRLGIPLLYGVDAIHGHAHMPAATVFPHSIGLGAANNPDLVQSVAAATAKELSATGVNWNYAPNLDQPLDIRWGRVYEAFSDDPARVSELGAAYLAGLQHVAQTEERIFILATPKHYLGLGSMGWDTSKNKNFRIDQGVTPADTTALYERHLPPFRAAVEAGAISIMVGLNTWGETRTVFQKHLLTDMLKGEIGFRGFLVSDWYGVYEGRKSKFWATVEAINAGVDMVMLPFDYQTFTTHLTWANRLGLVTDARIDDAVSRILYAKFALGLFDAGGQSLTAVEIPNQAHRALARQAVSESLVLLKNEAAVLPLSQNTPHIRVAGSAAHNIGQQMGAWTIEWQGVDGNWMSNATSILDALRATVSADTLVEYDAAGVFASTPVPASVGIAIVGEQPYAEGWGDRAYPILSAEDRAAIKNLQATSEVVVVVVVSGRPLLMTEEVETAAALVAAWLPGSAGEGVADVLFGIKPFVGTLPLPWPRSAEQLPISSVGQTADGTTVLFPRGYGLR